MLETPDRKLLAEFPVTSNGAFVGQTSQVQAFVHQVNATSSCATLGCTGLLKPNSVKLTGLGGAVNIDYDCIYCTINIAARGGKITSVKMSCMRVHPNSQRDMEPLLFLAEQRRKG